MIHPAIFTKNLTRKFGKLTAVDSLNLEVPAGSVYGFLGPNGAGKTTTIRLLLGLIRLHAGHIDVFGRPFIKEKQPLLGQIGAMVESPSIYDHLTGTDSQQITQKLTHNSGIICDRIGECCYRFPGRVEHLPARRALV